MIKIGLVSGEIKFLTHKAEWVDQKFGPKYRTFLNAEQKNNFVNTLEKKNITPTITEYDLPSAELLEKCEGKKFNTLQEANAFVQGQEQLSETEILALAVAELYEMMSGGAV